MISVVKARGRTGEEEVSLAQEPNFFFFLSFFLPLVTENPLFSFTFSFSFQSLSLTELSFFFWVLKEGRN